MSGLNLDVKASNISLSICLNFNSYLMALFFNNLISTSKFQNKAKINENYIEPENHSASNRFTRRQNNSQLQSQNKNYRRQECRG
jgi:hypothetical protein